jgi:hypothetical protein
MPEGMELSELALRILMIAQDTQAEAPKSVCTHPPNQGREGDRWVR